MIFFPCKVLNAAIFSRPEHYAQISPLIKFGIKKGDPKAAQVYPGEDA
tara:strand:- start:14739 stop:14882 length:144 start_codon:yes stop_codon:yes gene_type:complete